MRRVAPTVSGWSPGSVSVPAATRSKTPEMKLESARVTTTMMATPTSPGMAFSASRPRSPRMPSTRPVRASAHGAVAGKRRST